MSQKARQIVYIRWKMAQFASKPTTSVC